MSLLMGSTSYYCPKQTKDEYDLCIIINLSFVIGLISCVLSEFRVLFYLGLRYRIKHCIVVERVGLSESTRISAIEGIHRFDSFVEIVERNSVVPPSV